ncbi:unnamed protein product [Pedinophyceae sp. YPF-701]|nr:unnamed protein product [Pedinophyceae sp. YPF-701]
MELQGRVSWEKADFERRSSGSHDVGHHLTMAEAVAQQESRDPAERRKFEDARKNHYNMRSVLALGRQLLEEDEEEDDEQGGANKTPANLQRQRAAKTPRASPQDDEGAGGKKRHRKLEEL